MRPIPIEEYFKYHPPTTAARKAAHEAINSAALHFAKTIDAYVVDADCLKMAMFAVQQARMFANQGITIDELQVNHDALDCVMGLPGIVIPVTVESGKPLMTGWCIRHDESGYRAELWGEADTCLETMPPEAWIYFASARDARDAIEKRRTQYKNGDAK
jgi:hypothetical protein